MAALFPYWKGKKDIELEGRSRIEVDVGNFVIVILNESSNFY